jgi:hypothetical protein
MKRALALVALVLLASNASAAWWPQMFPRYMRFQVGQTQEVEVWGTWSGIMAWPWSDWVIYSTNRNIVSAPPTVMTSPSQRIFVRVTGVAPGTATLMIRNYDKYPTTTIDIFCGDEDPIHAAEPRIAATIGKPVTLEAVTPIAHRTTFAWYRGRQGDQSSPLSASGPEISYAPVAGTQYVWVLATTPCSSSMAEFRVDGHPSKRRSVRR